MSIQKISILKTIKNFFLQLVQICLLIVFYIWLIIFFIIPILIVLKISFAKISYGIPPYSSISSWSNNQYHIDLNIDNYQYVKNNVVYLLAYINSLKISLISSTLCLIFAYPLAWSCYRIKETSIRNLVLMFIILPSWISFLVKVYSIMTLLENNGVLNNLLIYLKIIDTPLNIMYTDTAMYIASVYCYLPLMVLPIYNALTKIDYMLIEAAYNLGANYIKIFFKIILPLIKKGMISGFILVSVTTLGEYVIPELLGGSHNVILSKVIWEEFFYNHDWPVASALSAIVILSFLIPIILINKYKNK